MAVLVGTTLIASFFSFVAALGGSDGVGGDSDVDGIGA